MKLFYLAKARLFLRVLALMLTVHAEAVFAMSLIGFKVCIASEMRAQVTSSGQPVAGAQVVRKVTFDGKDYVTQVQTDAQGNFVLPVLYERTLWKNTPFEFRIPQMVTINYQGSEHVGVDIIRGNFDENGELNDMAKVTNGTQTLVPYQFLCELTNTETDRGVHSTRTVLSGKCLTTHELNSKKSN
ncbi:MAG: hypothetical protein RL497_2650 [Pseudomonadota bacterium]|jgi:hypothetical protein